MGLMIAAGITILLFFMIRHLTLYITITYRRKGGADLLTIAVATWMNLFHYGITIPLRVFIKEGKVWVASEWIEADQKKKVKRNLLIKHLNRWIHQYLLHPRELLQLFHLFGDYIEESRILITLLFRRLKCEKFSWQTDVGSQDAAETGILTGLLWSIKFFVLTYLLRHVPFIHAPVVQVRPRFQEPEFVMELECIFRLPLGNLINVIFNRMKNHFKEVKVNGRTSHTRIDEDCHGEH